MRWGCCATAHVVRSSPPRPLCEAWIHVRGGHSATAGIGYGEHLLRCRGLAKFPAAMVESSSSSWSVEHSSILCGSSWSQGATTVGPLRSNGRESDHTSASGQRRPPTGRARGREPTVQAAGDNHEMASSWIILIFTLRASVSDGSCFFFILFRFARRRVGSCRLPTEGHECGVQDG